MKRFTGFALVFTFMLAAISPAGAQLLESDEVRDIDPHQGRILADWITTEFQKRWKSEERQAPPVVDDATYLRRIYLDLLGTIPPVATAREFLNSEDPYKRDQVVELLLQRRRTAEHLAKVWRRMMVPTGSANEMLGVQIEPWLRDQFQKNTPYDEFARSLLTVTSADVSDEKKSDAEKANARAAVMFYQASGGDAEGAADSVTRFFLGVRLGCAKCHDHPFASWKQEQFWGTAAFFAGVQNGNVTDIRRESIRPKDGDKDYPVRYLWTSIKAEIPKDKFPRHAFADWMTDNNNPNFAATAVNRVWRHLCGRSLAGDVDDLDEDAAEERKLILDNLAKKFVESKYDLRELIRGICKSRVYQSSTLIIGQSADSAMADVRPLKTLSPEQMFDAMEQALMLPVGRSDNGARFNGQGATLMQRMNEAFSGTPEDFSAGIPQALMMMNGTIMSEATNLEMSRTLRATVDAPFLKDEDRLETLFLAALTRRPSEKEQQVMLKYLATQKDKKQAFGDIFWSLLNTPEFVLSR